MDVAYFCLYLGLTNFPKKQKHFVSLNRGRISYEKTLCISNYNNMKTYFLTTVFIYLICTIQFYINVLEHIYYIIICNIYYTYLPNQTNVWWY